MVLHPVADRLHPAIALPQVAELGHGEAVQPVRFAIAAGVKIGQYMSRQVTDPDLGNAGRIGPEMIDVDSRLAVQMQGPGFTVQTQQARTGVAVHPRLLGYGLAQPELFLQNELACRACGLDVEDEIAAAQPDIVVKLDREFQSDGNLRLDILHGPCYHAALVLTLGRVRSRARPDQRTSLAKSARRERSPRASVMCPPCGQPLKRSTA